jgi:hypothetical protein
MDELIYSIVTTALGITIGYLLKRQPAAEILERERVRVERVEVPKVVIKEVLKVERIEVPVIVEKHTVKVERVDVPRVVEKPVLQIERVAMPRAAAMPDSPSIPIVFMDASESREKGRALVDARARRPTMVHSGVKFICSRQNTAGEWIYRQA